MNLKSSSDIFQYFLFSSCLYQWHLHMVLVNMWNFDYFTDGLGENHMKVTSPLIRWMKNRNTPQLVVPNTVLLYFQTSLTHISLTAFQISNSVLGSHGTQLKSAWKCRFSLVLLQGGILLWWSAPFMSETCAKYLFIDCKHKRY